jgi:hypothetical protein
MKYQKDTLIAVLKEAYENEYGEMCDIEIYFDDLPLSVQSDLAKAESWEKLKEWVQERGSDSMTMLTVAATMAELETPSTHAAQVDEKENQNGR